MKFNWLGVFFRGVAMGAADIVPGVSGGTVAFLTGVFERLLRAVTSADREAFCLILEGRLSAFWHRLDGPFVATLLAGAPSGEPRRGS